MPVKRDADGNIVDERTGVVGHVNRAKSVGDRRSADSRTVIVGGKATDSTRDTARGTSQLESRDAGRYKTPTRMTSRDALRDSGRISRPTTIVRSGASVEDAAARFSDPMQDPPAGWLVIVDGPGRGAVATLGVGQNAIGRDASQRISLDYGDTTISRVNHAAITYDPRQRKFHILRGDGINLTYVEDELVLEARELEALAHVRIGDTVLRFVPFCGHAFSWDEESDEG